jgi:hypothetical protein
VLGGMAERTVVSVADVGMSEAHVATRAASRGVRSLIGAAAGRLPAEAREGSRTETSPEQKERAA